MVQQWKSSARITRSYSVVTINCAAFLEMQIRPGLLRPSKSFPGDFPVCATAQSRKSDSLSFL